MTVSRHVEFSYDCEDQETAEWFEDVVRELVMTGTLKRSTAGALLDGGPPLPLTNQAFSSGPTTPSVPLPKAEEHEYRAPATPCASLMPHQAHWFPDLVTKCPGVPEPDPAWVASDGHC